MIIPDKNILLVSASNFNRFTPNNLPAVPSVSEASYNARWISSAHLNFNNLICLGG